MQRRPNTSLLPLLLLALGGLSGCVVAVSGLAGLVVSQEFLADTTKSVQLEYSDDVTWPTVKVALSKLSTAPYETDDSVKAAQLQYDMANVVVHVQEYTDTECTIHITARKLGVHSKEVAQIVYEQIMREFESAGS